MNLANRVESVCVIGSGLSGLIALKSLTAEKCFKRIKCFEIQDKDGGIWNYTGEPGKASPIPSLDPSLSVDTTVSPIYSHMETNVPYYNMRFNNFPVADEQDKSRSLYSTYNEVSEYLQSIGNQFSDIIQHNTRVTAVEKVHGKWLVSTKTKSSTAQDIFDAVIVGSGSFNTPFLPDFPGLQDWVARYPGSVLHSRNYRAPDAFANKTVVVVGCEASGKDIAEASVPIAKKVYGVVRNLDTLNELKKDTTSGITWVGALKSFDPDSKSIETADAEIPNIEDVDFVVFATGYLRSYPFLTGVNSSEYPVVTDGVRAHNMFNHMYYTPDPTLVLLGLPKYVLPFRVFEAQAIHAARVLSGRLSLPSLEHRKQWELERASAALSERGFHDMQFPEDFKYCGNLTADIKQSKPGHSSLLPYEFDEDQQLQRKNLFKIRKAFRQYRKDTNISASSYQELVAKGYLELDPL